jgi:hypothetical protein
VAGIATFKRGYIWRIGTGENVNIYTDPWIPSSPNRKILTPRGQAVLTKVSELLDPISGSWDLDLLKTLFYDIDVNRILEIPLTNQGFDDFIAWNFKEWALLCKVGLSSSMEILFLCKGGAIGSSWLRGDESYLESGVGSEASK